METFLSYLHLVAPEHELPGNNPADAAGGADHKDGGVLRLRYGELAHGTTNEEDAIVLVGAGSGDLAESRELAPYLVEDLPRPAAEPNGIDVVERHSLLPPPLFRILPSLLFASAAAAKLAPRRARQRQRRGELEEAGDGCADETGGRGVEAGVVVVVDLAECHELLGERDGGDWQTRRREACR